MDDAIATVAVGLAFGAIVICIAKCIFCYIGVPLDYSRYD
jgi:hypothetical protein